MVVVWSGAEPGEGQQADLQAQGGWRWVLRLIGSSGFINSGDRQDRRFGQTEGTKE